MKKPQAVKWNRFRYPALSHETLDVMVYDAEQMDLFLEEQQQNLEAIRELLPLFDEEADKNDEAEQPILWLKRKLLALCNSAQNTDYVQKEEQE